MSQNGNADDFSLSRVPADRRESMFSIMLVRIGALTCISQFLIGAALGYGMTLWDAFWATMFGSVILQVVSALLGIAGAREGMSTSLLARWSGFGQYGSSIIGLIFAISLTGWFGVQNSVFAEGIDGVTGGKLGFVVASIITGVGTTLLVYFGFKWISWTAKITVPLFLIVMGIGIYQVLKNHSIAQLATMAPPGPLMTIGAATTMVAGGFIVGCVTTPDMTRFAKSGRDVVWITLVGTFLGEFGVNLIAVLMAHAVGSADIMSIVMQLTGLLGGAIVAFATLKINDMNLYSSSLGITNFLSTIFKINMNRGVLTLILGGLGTVLSIVGILDKFTAFLIILGVAIPPIAGIMAIDYYLLKRFRQELDTSRALGTLPEYCEKFNPVAIFSWLIGFAAGLFITWGVQALTSIIVSSVVYYVGMKLLAPKKVLDLTKG